jgi:hypothetical protein
MPWAMSASVPSPSAFSTLTGMILVFHATPATPMPLSVAAPTTPATCVPWPSSSMGTVSSATAS